ncbi:MAG: InlB B-repeat-containing protein, partial [Eubacterium sp.]
MRKERTWGKSVNRLLVLVLAVTVTLVFSFTSFSFADDSAGGAASGSESGSSVQSSDDAVSLESIPSRLTYYGTLTDSNTINLKTGQTATIVRRPYKATRCSTCGSIVYAYVPKTYYASDNAVKALSADGTAVSDAVKDAHFSLKSVTAANLPQFDGVQGLAFSFKGNRPGRYTVKYDYFFQYNSPGTGKNPVTCQNPDCEYYQKEPAYDVGGDHSTHRTENTINLTVTADYKLSYDANGGSGVSAAEELKDSTEGSQEFTLSSTVPERKGYSFLGWSENKDAKTADYRAGSKYTLTWPDTAKTLYAVWEKESTTPTNPVNPVTPVNPSTPSEEHTVTFHPANGQPDFTQTVPDGGQAVMPDDPVYNGYKFDGWYTDTDLSKAYDFSTKVNSSLNLYAKWTKSAEPVKPENQAKKVSGILLPKVIATGKHTQTLTW